MWVAVQWPAVSRGKGGPVRVCLSALCAVRRPLTQVSCLAGGGRVGQCRALSERAAAGSGVRVKTAERMASWGLGDMLERDHDARRCAVAQPGHA